MLLPSTSSSPTPSISPAVKWDKVYSIFPHKLLKLPAAFKDNAPQLPIQSCFCFPHFSFFVFLIFCFLLSSFFVFCFPHILFFVFLIFVFCCPHFLFFVFLIFSHLLLQYASCSHTWGKTPCPRSVFLVWKEGFHLFFIFAVWYYRQKWVLAQFSTTEYAKLPKSKSHHRFHL